MSDQPTAEEVSRVAHDAFETLRENKALRERHTALRAALVALQQENTETEDISWCRVCEEEWEPDQRSAHAPECPIGKIAALLQEHQP